MPVVRVHGVPSKITAMEMGEIKRSIISAMTEIKALGVSEGTISCIFPEDKIASGDEIIVFVEGFFIKEERVHSVRRETAEAVVKALKKSFPRSFVECFIRPFDPDDGYFSEK